MSTTPNEPTGASAGDSIRVVAQRTGLSMEVLRAWERRYGFPRPRRRDGSNRRVYAPEDVERLLRIRCALDAGYRIGDVVDKAPAELDALVRAEARRSAGAPASPRPEAPPVSPRAPLPPPGPVDPRGSVVRMLELLAADDVGELERALRHAAEALGPRVFVAQVAHPFVVAVGQAWADGRLSVRHEHVASECVTTQLRRLLASYQDLVGSPTVLLTTLPDEHHALGLQMLAVHLATAGARPRLLGVSTPVHDIAEAARVLRADVVGLGVTEASDASRSRRAVVSLGAALLPRVAIWVGGAGAGALGLAPPLATTLGGWDEIDAALAAWRRGAA